MDGVGEMFAEYAGWEQVEFDWQFSFERLSADYLSRVRGAMARLHARRKSAGSCAKCDSPPSPGRTRCPFHEEMNRTACLRAYNKKRGHRPPGTWHCGTCGVAGHNARTCVTRKSA